MEGVLNLARSQEIQPNSFQDTHIKRNHQFRGQAGTEEQPKIRAALKDGIKTEAIIACGETGIHWLTKVFKKAWEEKGNRGLVACSGSINLEKEG